MKKIVLASVLTASLMAGDFCAQFEQLATAIMYARNNGAPMSKAMKVAGGNSIVRKMVVDAYDQPLYQTESVVKAQQKRFVNKWTVWCYDSLMKGK
jgi:hypothetical protein